MFSLYLSPRKIINNVYGFGPNIINGLWKTINAPLCGFGVCVYGFLGGYSFGLFEGGWLCPLSRCGGVVGVWVGCGVGVGVGWVVLPFPGEFWGLSFRGEQDGISLLAEEGRVWGLVTGYWKPHEPVPCLNSKPVEAFDMSFTNLSPLPKKCWKWLR